MLWVAIAVLTTATAVAATGEANAPSPVLRQLGSQGNVTTGSCQFQYETNSWDLSSLSLPYGEFYMTEGAQGYYYLLNVCGNVACTTNNNGQQSALCQTRPFQPTNYYHQIGYYTGYSPSGLPATWDLIDSTQPGMGLKFTMANGDSCSNVLRTVTVYFDCDPTRTSYTQNFTITQHADPNSCIYDLHFPTNRSCIPGFVPPAPPTVVSSTAGPGPQPAVSSSSTGGAAPKVSSSSTGRGPVVLSSTGPFVPSNSTGGDSGPLITLSAGSWFCVGFAVFSFAYVLFGCIHRRVTYGVVGCDAFPNYPFWSRLPGLVGDGFRWTWYKVRCRAVPPSNYKDLP